MKKYLAIVLAVLMLFSATGCAVKTAEAPVNSEPTAAASTEPA